MRPQSASLLSYLLASTISFHGNVAESPSLEMYPSATTHTAIEETLALWPLSIDSKQYALVPQIFTASPFAQLVGRNLTGTPAILNFLAGFLTNVSSHHQLGQLQVNQTGPDSASAEQYLTASFFGQGAAMGRMYQAFGLYKDEMVGDDKGRWLVQNRVLINYGSSGDDTLLALTP